MGVPSIFGLHSLTPLNPTQTHHHERIKASEVHLLWAAPSTTKHSRRSYCSIQCCSAVLFVCGRSYAIIPWIVLAFLLHISVLLCDGTPSTGGTMYVYHSKKGSEALAGGRRGMAGDEVAEGSLRSLERGKVSKNWFETNPAKKLKLFSRRSPTRYRQKSHQSVTAK